MKRRKPLRAIRIQLPKGIEYEALELGRILHGASSLSRYILTAAMTYTNQFIRERADAINQTSDLRNTSEPTNAGDDDSTE